MKGSQLSDLPNDIMVHIFSFTDTKFAVQTCLMFKQWNHLWTKLPILNYHINNFESIYTLSYFLLRVVKRSELCNLKCFNITGRVLMDQDPFDVLIAAVVKSQRVRQLSITHAEFNSRVPLLLSTHWLKVVELNRCFIRETPNCLNILTLKTLLLEGVFFVRARERHDDRGGVSHNDCFSLSCPNLEKLVLRNICVDIDGIRPEIKLFCPKLVSLSILHLEFMDINHFTTDVIIRVCAPRLASFDYRVSLRCVLCVDDALASLETVSIDLYAPDNQNETHEWKDWYFYNIMNTFKLLSNANSLTLMSKAIEALSMFPLLLEKQVFPFKTLKTLKLRANKKLNSTPGVINFLCRGNSNDEIMDIEYM